MKNYNYKIERVLSFIRNQWKPVSLAVVILSILIVTLLIPSGEKNTRKYPGRQVINNQPPKNSPESSKNSNNAFSFLFGSKKNDSSNQQNNNPTSVRLPQNLTSAANQSTITKVMPDGTKTTQNVTGNADVKTIQGTIKTNSNISSDLASNTEVDNLRIVFQNADGTTFTYIPPGTPPDEVRWARYTNNVAKYAINYPSNWQFVYSISDGNEGVALYPHGVSINDPKAPFIGFGIADNFLSPADVEGANSQITPILVDGISGNLYTNGPLGYSRIASVMSYNSKYFGLGGSKSDATFAYVYYYMIHSLTFNIE